MSKKIYLKERSGTLPYIGTNNECLICGEFNFQKLFPHIFLKTTPSELNDLLLYKYYKINNTFYLCEDCEKASYKELKKRIEKSIHPISWWQEKESEQKTFDTFFEYNSHEISKVKWNNKLKNFTKEIIYDCNFEIEKMTTSKCVSGSIITRPIGTIYRYDFKINDQTHVMQTKKEMLKKLSYYRGNRENLRHEKVPVNISAKVSISCIANYFKKEYCYEIIDAHDFEDNPTFSSLPYCPFCGDYVEKWN